MTQPNSRTRSERLTLMVGTAALLLSGACASVPAPATAPLASPGTPPTSVPQLEPEPRELRLGDIVRGTLAARGDADEYVLRVDRGEDFTAVLAVPHQQPEVQLQLQVFRQDAVTGELNQVGRNSAGSGDGEAAGTTPFEAEAGTYVLRVQGVDRLYAGRYSLRAVPTKKGSLTLGQSVQGELDGRGDGDDYTITLPRGARIVGRLTVPHAGKETSLQLYLYRRDPVTGELQHHANVIVHSTDGQPGATRVVESPEGGTYVARVQGMDLRHGGRYAVSVERP